MVTETIGVTALDTANSLCFAIADGQGGDVNFLDILNDLHTLLTEGQSLPQDGVDALLGQLDRVASHGEGVLTNVGLRMKTLATTRAELEQYRLSGQQLAAELNDLDYPAAITRLNQYLTAIESARKSLATVGNLSLFQYLSR